MTWPGGDSGYLSSVSFDVVQKSLQPVVICGGGGYGKGGEQFWFVL